MLTSHSVVRSVTRSSRPNHVSRGHTPFHKRGKGSGNFFYSSLLRRSIQGFAESLQHSLNSKSKKRIAFLIWKSMSALLGLQLCNVTCPLSNYVSMQEVTSCSQPLNYQPTNYVSMQEVTSCSQPFNYQPNTAGTSTLCPWVLQRFSKTLYSTGPITAQYHHMSAVITTSKSHL